MAGCSDGGPAAYRAGSHRSNELDETTAFEEEPRLYYPCHLVLDTESSDEPQYGPQSHACSLPDQLSADKQQHMSHLSYADLA